MGVRVEHSAQRGARRQAERALPEDWLQVRLHERERYTARVRLHATRSCHNRNCGWSQSCMCLLRGSSQSCMRLPAAWLEPVLYALPAAWLKPVLHALPLNSTVPLPAAGYALLRCMRCCGTLQQATVLSEECSGSSVSTSDTSTGWSALDMHLEKPSHSRASDSLREVQAQQAQHNERAAPA